MAQRGKAPANGTSVFFSNVPYGTTSGYLTSKIFSQAGHVKELELYTNARGTSIGAGIVIFDSAETAQHAVDTLHDMEVDGRPMLVKLDERAGGNPNAAVFFNGVPYVTTEGFLRSKFEACGTITDFDLWRRPDGSSHGMGTCEYSTMHEAENAIATLHGIMVDGRQLMVQKNQRPEGEGEDSLSGRKGNRSKGGWQPKGGGKGDGKGYVERRVFWSNANWETTEGYLRSRFEQVGTVVDFDFWRRPDGLSLGKGTCEFDHYLGAWRAQERLHGVEIDGFSLLVKSDGVDKAGAGTGGKGRGGKNWDKY